MDSSAPSFPKNPTLPSRETSKFSEDEQVERLKRALGFYDAPIPGLSSRISLAESGRYNNLSGFKKSPGPQAPLGPRGLRLQAMQAEEEAKRNSLVAKDSFEISNDKEKARLAQTFRPVSDEEASRPCKKVEADAERKTEAKDEGQGAGGQGLGKKLGKMFGSKRRHK